ncbi:MAG: ArnT family glycosyltransferase [Candidatus Kapaibacterium sp.]
MMPKATLIITYILTIAAAVIFLLAAVPEIYFPYEGHWMEGAMLSEVSWILSHHTLYSTPSIYHVPSVYQPLYYYVTAGITSIIGLSFATARITSVLATAATLAMIYFVVKKETGKFFYAVSAMGLYIAAYGKTEYSYFSARIDPLLTCLIVAAFIMVYYADSYRGLFAGALFFAVCFFTKQSAMVFIPPVCFYALLTRGWKQGAFFLGATGGLILLGVLLLNSSSDGWYTFYTFKVLRFMANSARWGSAVYGFFFYIFLRCWFFSILLLVFPLRFFIRKSERSQNRGSIYFGLFFATGIIAGFLGIVNAGGGHNVLFQAAAGCAIFLPILISKIVHEARFGTFVQWLIPLQLLFLISNPWGDSHNVIRDPDAANYRKFFDYVSSLPGEVWIPYHSFLTQYTRKAEYTGFDFAAGAMLPDDPRALNLRNQFDTAYSHGHWSNILSDYKQNFPHYRLSDMILNLNKFHGSDDSLLYLYTPVK